MHVHSCSIDTAYIYLELCRYYSTFLKWDFPTGLKWWGKMTTKRQNIEKQLLEGRFMRHTAFIIHLRGIIFIRLECTGAQEKW